MWTAFWFLKEVQHPEDWGGSFFLSNCTLQQRAFVFNLYSPAEKVAMADSALPYLGMALAGAATFYVVSYIETKKVRLNIPLIWFSVHKKKNCLTIA